MTVTATMMMTTKSTKTTATTDDHGVIVRV
jgi:hypothetical protein